MKKNGIKKTLALTATLSLIAPSFSNAGITGVRNPGSPSKNGTATSSGSGSVTVKQGKPVDEKVDIKEGSASVSCKQDPDSSPYFPLDFFQQISRDGSPLTFEIRDNNKIMVKIPASLDICGKFKPQMYQDPQTKNVTLMMVNDQGKTYGEYIECLKKDGKETTETPKAGDVATTTSTEDSKKQTKQPRFDNDKINHDLYSGKEYSEYSYVIDFDFDKTRDVKKSLKLSYGYPKAHQGKTGYPTVYGKDTAVELPSSLCMDAEKIAADVTYINKGQDALLEDLKATCNSRDAQRIAEARKSIGNADALKDIAEELKSKLDAAYLVAVKADVDKIYEELTKIENEINKNKDMDEVTAKKKTKRYAELVKDLDSKFLNPAIYRLDELMKKFAELEDGDAKSKLGDEIKKLNEEIAAFAKRNSTSLVNLYSLMEKYAINDSAKIIENIRLKSFLYSKVFPAGNANDPRGKAISFEEANQRQVKGEQNFDRTLNDWSDVYLVGQGSMVPIRKTEVERQRAITKMNTRWQTYQQNEYKQYYQYCGTGMTGGVKNPIQCQTFLKGVDKRRTQELRRRDKDLAYVKTRNEKLDKMGISYNTYQAKQAEREIASEDNSPYGASYSGYETTFEERFPQYDSSSLGSTAPGSMNPQMYSMMGQNGMMMGQERMMGYQGQQQYMGMPGQYQYQMQPMMYQ
jgi:hypothetical protein